MVNFSVPENQADDTEDFISIVEENIGTPSVVMEIGALDADDSALFKKAWPSARVIAVEGLKENYETHMLKKDGIEAVHAVVAEKDGPVTFHTKGVQGLHSIYDRGQQYGTDHRNVDAVSLKTLCEGLGVESIDVMKIDTEGSTWDVLKGMGPLLGSLKVLHAETEDAEFFRHQHLDSEVTDLLKDSGLILVFRRSCEILPGKRQYDSVWLRGSNGTA